MSASSPGPRVVGVEVRGLAEALAALFAADQRLAMELRAARWRLLDATDVLRVGVSAGALRALLGVAGDADLGSPVAVQAASLTGLETVADGIRGALGEYQSAAEQRRLVAGDIGEATVRLVGAMAVDGFTEVQARGADVWALRDGVYRQGVE